MQNLGKGFYGLFTGICIVAFIFDVAQSTPIKKDLISITALCNDLQSISNDTSLTKDYTRCYNESYTNSDQYSQTTALGRTKHTFDNENFLKCLTDVSNRKQFDLFFAERLLIPILSESILKICSMVKPVGNLIEMYCGRLLDVSEVGTVYHVAGTSEEKHVCELVARLMDDLIVVFRPIMPLLRVYKNEKGTGSSTESFQNGMSDFKVVKTTNPIGDGRSTHKNINKRSLTEEQKNLGFEKMTLLKKINFQPIENLKIHTSNDNKLKQHVNAENNMDIPVLVINATTSDTNSATETKMYGNEKIDNTKNSSILDIKSSATITTTNRFKRHGNIENITNLRTLDLNSSHVKTSLENEKFKRQDNIENGTNGPIFNTNPSSTSRTDNKNTSMINEDIEHVKDDSVLDRNSPVSSTIINMNIHTRHDDNDTEIITIGSISDSNRSSSVSVSVNNVVGTAANNNITISENSKIVVDNDNRTFNTSNLPPFVLDKDQNKLIDNSTKGLLPLQNSTNSIQLKDKIENKTMTNVSQNLDKITEDLSLLKQNLKNKNESNVSSTEIHLLNSTFGNVAFENSSGHHLGITMDGSVDEGKPDVQADDSKNTDKYVIGFSIIMLISGVVIVAVIVITWFLQREEFPWSQREQPDPDINLSPPAKEK